MAHFRHEIVSDLGKGEEPQACWGRGCRVPGSPEVPLVPRSPRCSVLLPSWGLCPQETSACTRQEQLSLQMG